MYMFTPPAQVFSLNALAVQTPVEDRQTDTTSVAIAVNPHILYDTSPGSRPGEEEEERRGGVGRRERRLKRDGKEKEKRGGRGVSVKVR